MSIKKKLAQMLGRKPTKDEVDLGDRIGLEMDELTKRSKEFVLNLIEEGYLTGNLKQLSHCIQNAVNVEIWRRETYADMCRLRAKEEKTPLKELRICEESEQQETKDLMNTGFA